MAPSLSDKELDAVVGIMIFLGVLSLIGSSGIIASYFRYKELRSFSFQMIAWLAVSDIGSNIGDLMGSPRDGSAACGAQAFIKQFFEIATILWTTVIAYSLYKTIAMKDFSDQRMTPYHIYVWGSALLLALIPVNYYGQTTGWCWITITSVVDFDPGTALRFFCFYVPLWLAVIFNAFAYYSVTRSVRGMLAAQTEETSDRLLRLVRRLRWYPFIMIIAYFWATINRIYNSINPGQPVFWLIFLQAAFRSAQGLMNSMAYGYNPTVREAWRKECCAAGSTCAAVLQMTKLQHPSEAPMNTEEPSTTDDAAPEGVEIHVELQESTANPV